MTKPQHYPDPLRGAWSLYSGTRPAFTPTKLNLRVSARYARCEGSHRRGKLSVWRTPYRAKEVVRMPLCRDCGVPIPPDVRVWVLGDAA